MCKVRQGTRRRCEASNINISPYCLDVEEALCIRCQCVADHGQLMSAMTANLMQELWFANRASPDMPNTCTQSCCICGTGNILWALLRSCAMSAVLPVILSLVFVRMPIVLIFDLCKCAAPAPTLLSRRLMRPIASFPNSTSLPAPCAIPLSRTHFCPVCQCAHASQAMVVHRLHVLKLPLERYLHLLFHPTVSVEDRLCPPGTKLTPCVCQQHVNTLHA